MFQICTLNQNLETYWKINCLLFWLTIERHSYSNNYLQRVGFKGPYYEIAKFAFFVQILMIFEYFLSSNDI